MKNVNGIQLNIMEVILFQLEASKVTPILNHRVRSFNVNGLHINFCTYKCLIYTSSILVTLSPI